MNITAKKCLNVLFVFVVAAHVATVAHSAHLRVQEDHTDPPEPDQICKTCMMLYDVYDSALNVYNASTKELITVGLAMCDGFIGPDFQKYKKPCRDIVNNTGKIMYYIKKDLSGHPTCQKLNYCSGCRPCPGMADCIICDGKMVLDESVLEIERMPLLFDNILNKAKNIFNTALNMTTAYV